MRLNELLTELTFAGRKCTKDCSGHMAGYAWNKQHKSVAPCTTPSNSFNNGCEIATNQQQTGKIARPKVRDPRGKFAPNPQQRKPAQAAPTTPQKPVAPQQKILYNITLHTESYVMAQAIDDVYFMVMTGVWKMADLESWAAEREEAAVEAAREDIEKEAYDEGHTDGYKEGVQDAQKAVEDLL